MIEVDCRKCVNCDLENDCCKKYGSDPYKATQLCAQNQFREYKHEKPFQK